MENAMLIMRHLPFDARYRNDAIKAAVNGWLRFMYTGRPIDKYDIAYSKRS